jgi:membrane-associated phospholipid phosphatase
MTEAEIEVAVGRRTRPSVLSKSTLVLCGRVLALAMAFFVIRAIVAAPPSFPGIIQPLSLAAILLIAGLARRSSSALLAVGYVLMFLVFLIFRPTADETFIPVHYDYPILFDRVLFLGHLPTLWLQDLFYVPDEVGLLDLVLSGVYITYFVAPHLAVLAVWRTRPQLFPKAILGVSLCFMIGLFFYFTIPTAPPWLASDTGDIDANVTRILPEVSAQLAGDTYDEASAAVGENDVAAMPSLHTGLTAMVAIIMACYGRRWRLVGLTYLGLMALALVYLGEHYVIDEIGGIVMAIGIWKLISHHRMFAALNPPVESEDEAPAVATAENRAA